ncbi:MAG: RpiB/LacA/LacB family sugar-phosphate isomerase [Eubacterium sp.]|nr:RpiB/LacA/LacB family sugar-phosphate isomerase [Eubacterium sp.]
MKIAFGVDNFGFELKESVLQHLRELGHEVVEVGSTDQDHLRNYIQVGHDVSELVTSGKCDRGIVVCGTGVGITIATNKNKGISCAFVNDVWFARICRIVNNANIMALGSSTTTPRIANDCIDVFLGTEWGEGLSPEDVERVHGEVQMLRDYENEYFK